jgi:hypothetical protein
VAAYYIPSADEVEGFNELLEEVPHDLFTAETVRTLAGDYWARRAAGKTIQVRIPGSGIDWQEIAVPPLKPEATPATSNPEPASAAPPKVAMPKNGRGQELTVGVLKARQGFLRQYGLEDRPGVIQGGGEGFTVTADGRVTGGDAGPETQATLAAMMSDGSGLTWQQRHAALQRTAPEQ